MPLIILTGYPCSGLSYRAKQLAALLEATQDQLLSTNESEGDESAARSRYKFHVVPSHDTSHPRTVYGTARTEKEARAVAFTRVKRALGRDTFVILDGMNYIKGWRYQLWCEAKAVGTTCCTVHVGTPIDKCVAINNARLQRQGQQLPETDGHGDDDSKATTEDLAEPDHEEAYPPELLNNLIFRYEEPTTHSRWDKPLFTVPWSDSAPPAEEIWTAVTGIALERTSVPSTTSTTLLTPTTDTSSASPSYPLDSDAASVAFTTATTIGGGRAARTKIKPHLATAQPLATDPTALYGFEKRSTAIVTAIRTFTQANPSAEAALARCQQLTTRSDQEGISIPVPETSTPVFIPAHVARSATTDDLAGAGGILTLPRLQRLRRQWISLNRSYAGTTSSSRGGGLRVDQVGDAFVRFLNAELAGENVAS